MITLSVEAQKNERVELIRMTHTEWSIVAKFLKILDAGYVTSGVIPPVFFPAIRSQLMYILNSAVMLHYFSSNLQHNGRKLLESVLDLVADAAKRERPIIWQDFLGVLDEPIRLKLEADTYVVGDLRSIVNVEVSDAVLSSPIVLSCGDRFIYSYPVYAQQHEYYDSDNQVYRVSSAFALVPKCLANEHHGGREIVLDQDFEVWFENKVLHVDYMYFDLSPKIASEEVCRS